MPDFREYAVPVPEPGTGAVESTRVLGTFLRDVMRENMTTFRVFAPDENNSNRLDAVLEVTDRAWMAERLPGDDHLAPDGRVMEILSEHICQGWLEGYLLTGRHGFFSCYEAFIHVVDSMFNQHAKWLKTTNGIPWRRPIASLNYLLTSHVWRQDHNGFSHQDPGFIDHVVNKKADVIRVYLPPDANTLLSVADHCLRSRQYVNVIVAGKQPALQYLTIDDADRALHQGHRHLGLGQHRRGRRARRRPRLRGRRADDGDARRGGDPAGLLPGPADPGRQRRRPDAAAGRPAASARALRRRVRRLFTADKPVIFAYHGYPWLIHRLTYRRTNHHNFHVRGYVEEGTTTTPFDICVLNRIDRFNLAIDVIDRVPRLRTVGAHARDRLRDQLIEHRQYVRSHGEDLPEIRDWQWTGRVRVLVVNAGSSSLKLARLDADGAVTAATTVEAWQGEGHLAPLGQFLADCGPVEAVGHRVVHGGPRHSGPVRVDDLLVSYLYSISHLAPLHNPRALAGVRAVHDLLPGVPAVACFDTTFHATLPAGRRTPTPCRGSGTSGGGCGGTASTGCRTPTPSAVAPSSPADPVEPHRQLPPRRGRLARRRPGRHLGGHDHGLHAAGRAGDEHPAGHPRPRAPALAARARPRARARAGRRPRAPLRAEGAVRHVRRPARGPRRTGGRRRGVRAGLRRLPAPAGPRDRGDDRGPRRSGPAGADRRGGGARVAGAGGPGRGAAAPRGSRWTRSSTGRRPADADISAPGAVVRTVVVTAREDLEIRRQVLGVLA